MKPYHAKKLPLKLKLSKKIFALESQGIKKVLAAKKLDMQEAYIPFLLKEESFFSLKRFNSKLHKQPFYQYCSSFAKIKDYKGSDYEEIVHYYEAILSVVSCKKITKKLIFTLHETIKKGRLGIKQKPFSFREYQNWIGKEGCLKEEAYFFPPHPDEIEKLMDNLLVYINQPKEHPLIQLAIAFAQFLIIHPFMDGNGRVARAMIPFFFKKHQLMPYPLLFLSEYFQKFRLEYFEKLYCITHGNAWEDWIAFFLKGVLFSVDAYQKKVLKISKVYNKLLHLKIRPQLASRLVKEIVLPKEYFLASQEKKNVYQALVREKFLGIKKGSSWVALKGLIPLMNLKGES